MPLTEMPEEFDEELEDELEEELELENEDIDEDEDEEILDDEEEEDDEDDEDDDPKYDDSDLEDYGKKVQKRVGKAIFERNTALERAERAENELKELREKALKADRERFESEFENLKSKREEQVKKLEELYDEDSSPREIAEATSELSRMDASLLEFEQVDVDTEFQDDYEYEVQPKYAPAAESWLADNPWYGDDNYGHIAAVAAAIEEGLRQKEGYKLGKSLYAELDKRLEASFPEVAELREGGKPKRKVAKRKRGRSRVAGQTSGDLSMPNKPVKGKLTDTDIKSMRKYNLDPSKPADRKAWLNRNSTL